MNIMNVILEKFPYRYIEMDNLLENGHPDYRIQKFHDWTRRYRDMYLLDNSIQLDYVIEDFEYTKWLDPDPCLLYTSPSPRDKRQSRMPSSA